MTKGRATPEIADIGPKAESLRRLADAGLPVPEARFLGIEAYREHCARAGVDAGAGPQDAREAILRAPLSEDVAERVSAWYRDLGEDHVAVRSSATVEDLPGMSFAGQHGTYFVGDGDALLRRVRDCWASLYSQRAVSYRERNGIAHGGVAMGVIVQRLVAATAAGVAFTASPVDGSDDVVVEACLGIGEALVSGKVTPDRFVFARDGLAVREVVAGDKRVRIVADITGGAHEESVPPAQAASLSISEDVARDVARLALLAEESLGSPADVEWAFDGDRVWLLQARPITTLARGAASTPPEAPTIWSNVNTGEILPGVATPMTWTIIHGHAAELFGGVMGALGLRVDTSKLIGLVGGRVYFNLSLLRESFRHLPNLDPDIALGGMHDFVDLPPLPDLPARSWRRWLSLARAFVSMPAYILRHKPKKAPRFAAVMREVAETNMRAADAEPDAAGAYRLVRDLDAHFGDFNDALAFMVVAMFGYGALGTLTDRWFADKTGAIATRLVAGQGGLASAESGHAMWRLSTLARSHPSVRGPVLLGIGWADVRDRLEEAALAGDAEAGGFLDSWDTFMAEYGHHRRGELEFANATWAERPDYILGIVRSYLVDDASADPIAAYALRAVDADTAADECRARLRGPLRRAAFDRVLGWGRASARIRENVKSEAVRWLVAIRYALLALGRRMAEAGALVDPEDIFFLEYGELEGLVRDPAARDWRALVASRRAEHERLEKLSPPPVVVGTWDEGASAWSVPRDAKTLKGISVSSGVVRGRARVFLAADTEEAVLPGEILVAPFTDPGWTPYFVPAAGIVMDMGGLLSHGSIIAREYGIPAVVNVGPATRIITTGQMIEVDGDKGEVRILG
ncbi:MAG: PEP/pyruvate-binding domain-containing protein [Coriobacteriia bacterium]